MKFVASLVLCAISVAGLSAPAAHADSFSSMTTTTTEQSLPITEVRETRTTTEDFAPSTTTVIREQPVILTQPANSEVIVVKQHRHHLIHVGPVKVF
jgi:hypothetical protein